MDFIIEQTFQKRKEKSCKKAKYDATNLEHALSDPKGLGELAHMKLKDLKKAEQNKHNPLLRVCVTTMVYDQVTGGFNPLIIDSEDESQDYTVMGAGRSTSAAPTYFRGYKGDHFDGGIYANDPKYWGLSLAILKTKIENIRVMSFGTGF